MSSNKIMLDDRWVLRGKCPDCGCALAPMTLLQKEPPIWRFEMEADVPGEAGYCVEPRGGCGVRPSLGGTVRQEGACGTR